MQSSPINEQELASVVTKESSSKLAQTKEKQVMVELICESQARIEAVYFVNDDGVNVVELDKDDKNSGIEADQEVELQLRKGSRVWLVWSR